MILRHFLVKHRISLLLTSGLLAAGAVLSLSMLAYVNNLATNNLSGSVSFNLLKGTGILLALLFANALSQYITAKIGAEFVMEVRAELARRIISAEFEEMEHRKHLISGVLIQDVNRIAPLAVLVPQLIYSLMVAILCSGYLLFISPYLFLVLSAFTVLTAIATFFLGRATRGKFEKMRTSEGLALSYFQALSAGKKEMTINPARSGHFLGRRLFPAIETARTDMLNLHTLWGLNSAWIGVVLYGALLLIGCLGGAVFHLPVGTVVKFSVCGIFLFGPINFITQSSQQMSVGFASLRHLEHVGRNFKQLFAMSTGDDENPVSGSNKDWQEIKAVDLEYTYHGKQSELNPALGPISLSVKRGEVVFITGGNGSGKSTLLAILCGLIKPKRGSVLVDGQSIELNLQKYRRRFSGVFNDFFLFPDVINSDGENLADQEIQRLLEKMELANCVDVKDGQFSTTDLSTGQRKRLALIQSCAEDREIVFLDEWAADQDPHFRAYFYREFIPQLKSLGKTIILVSHDDRYFDSADRIIKLENGMLSSELSKKIEERIKATQ